MTDTTENQIERLIEIIAALRGENGCPWDKKQTFKSLKNCVMEECAELADAVENEDYDEIKEELGDILMHVVLHSQIAKENGLFDINDVAGEISDKMIRRHPHVFADHPELKIDEINTLWEKIKEQEKPDRFASRIDGVPRNLPPLLKAFELQKKAAKAGFEWTGTDDVINKIEEELHEVKEAVATGHIEEIEDEIGDLLFSTVCLTRFLKTDSPAALLERAVKKFESRFREMESVLDQNGRDFNEYSKEELKKLWTTAKNRLEK